MRKYKAILQRTIICTASNYGAALRTLMESEGCPENAIVELGIHVPDEMMKQAAECNDINAACCIIQNEIDQNDGGIAGIYFSEHEPLEDGNTVEWRDASVDERMEMLRGYIKLEQQYDDDDEEEERRVKCNQCNVLRINGLHCHEHGCPNQGKVYDPVTEEWNDRDRPEDDEYEY